MIDKYTMDLINLALDLKDKKWFEELTSKCKNNTIEDDIQNEDMEHINSKIALENMKNNDYAIRTKDGVRKAKSLEELETYNLVKICSKKVDCVEIIKGEEVNIEELTIEQKFIYKLSYYQYNKGFDDCKNIYSKYFEECLSLRKQLDGMITVNSLLAETYNILIKKIKSASI